MLKLIALLSGGTGLWWALGIAVVLLATGGSAGYVTRGVIDSQIISHQETLTAQSQKETSDEKVRTQQCIVRHETARANGAEQAVTAMIESVNEAAKSVDNLARMTSKREKNTAQFFKEISNVTPSQVCASSPAELAYRRSVLREGSDQEPTP
jgi:hypothetical protein